MSNGLDVDLLFKIVGYAGGVGAMIYKLQALGRQIDKLSERIDGIVTEQGRTNERLSRLEGRFDARRPL